MALDPKYADRVKETSTITGTGTITLLGATTAHQSFFAGIGDAEKCLYCIEDLTNDAFEIGYGTVASTTTLSREAVLTSTNANSFVNFSAGTKNVFCVAPSRSFMEVGCRLYKTNNQSINNTTWTAVEWNAESWDPFDMHDLVTNPSRVTITVPGRYEVKALTPWEDNTTGSRGVAIYKNGVFYTGLQRFDCQNNMGFLTEFVVHYSDEVECAAGDYLEIYVWQSSGAGLNIQGGISSSSFCVRRVSS